MQKQPFWKHWGDGPAIAAIVSAGIGCAVIGIATVLTEASPAIKNLLNWWNPAGPLIGKTGVGLSAWLGSWLILHLIWKKRELPFFEKAWKMAMVLIVIGLLGTFPPVFQLFSHGH